MGLFRKKPDPLAQRAQTLNRKIAELEAEIARLNRNVTPAEAESAEGRAGKGSRPGGGTGQGQGQAQGQGGPRGVGRPAVNEPVFERMPARPVEPAGPAAGPGEEAMALGLKRPAWSQWWRRLKTQIVDPPPANEKLVNYLAAGGIQGLRPLRFERRIARNRIIFVCVVLGLLLWGLMVMFRHTR